MIAMFRLSEKKFLVVAWHCKQKVDHSKAIAAINKQPPLLGQCSWPTDSYSAETIRRVIGMVSCSANCKHQSVNEMMLPCRRMWQGTSIWRQHTTRITCSALRMDGQGDRVHVHLFATVHNTGASEAYAELLSFICTWWDLEKDFARVLVPVRVGGMCVWVAACRTKIDNWIERD